MKAIKYFSFLLLLSLTFSCVERYYPNDDNLITGVLVVNAHLNNLDNKQTITISRSDDLSNSHFMPESGSYVELEDENGETLEFIESNTGKYTITVPSGFIQLGKAYKLNIITNNGNVYTSEQEIPSIPRKIDSIYYELETKHGINNSDTTNGIQFFIDYEIEEDKLSYTRWELIETYEFHNPNYKQNSFIYGKDRILRHMKPEEYYRFCWITDTIPDINTQSTKNLSGTSFVKHPLHYVSNQTQRLYYKYSVLIRQHSLSEKAFQYWNDLENNSNTSGGLTDKQPSLAISNICNCNDPDEHVIGYFSISGVSEQRVFVDPVEGLEIPEGIFCFPDFEYPKLWFISKDRLPVYLAKGTWPFDGKEYFGLIAKHCLDCRAYDGSQGNPPDFWQE